MFNIDDKLYVPELPYKVGNGTSDGRLCAIGAKSHGADRTRRRFNRYSLITIVSNGYNKPSL